MGISTDDYYAREADRIARGPQLYGGNAAIVQLRCFKYYHPDMGSFLTDPGGRDRWLGPKASRVYAILHRVAGSGQRVTMTHVASEAMCSTSTVSRAVTRLQSWGMLAVDTTRGRNGGMIVRLPDLVPAMRHYIAAAWKRIRSWINVASRSQGGEEGIRSTLTLKDATFTDEFSEAFREAERRGRLLVDEIRANPTPTLARGDGAFNPGRLTVPNVINARFALDRDEPDWDLIVSDPNALRAWQLAVQSYRFD